MKFVIAAVVLLAVTMGVQSSIIPGLGLGLGYDGLGLGYGHGLGVNHLGLGLGHGVAVGVHGQSLSQGPAWWGGPAAAVDISGHGLLGHGLVGHGLVGHGLVGHGLVGHGATYVAKTRGAVHTAPLAGHINSVASVNAAPAPGTW